MTSHLSSGIPLPPEITLDQITHFAASAVILNKHQQVLMLFRDDYPVWTNIGGLVEPGESFEQALRREIKEETNLEVTIIREGGDYFSLISKDGPPRYTHERIYLCQPKSLGSAACLGDEGIALKWFDQNNLPANIPPRYRIRIVETIENSSIKTSLLIVFPRTQEFINHLKLEDIEGLEKWLSHPKVLQKKQRGQLKFWPENFSNNFLR